MNTVSLKMNITLQVFRKFTSLGMTEAHEDKINVSILHVK